MKELKARGGFAARRSAAGGLWNPVKELKGNSLVGVDAKWADHSGIR